jgi:hypothetical protein
MDYITPELNTTLLLSFSLASQVELRSDRVYRLGAPLTANRNRKINLLRVNVEVYLACEVVA